MTNKLNSVYINTLKAKPYTATQLNIHYESGIKQVILTSKKQANAKEKPSLAPDITKEFYQRKLRKL